MTRIYKRLFGKRSTAVAEFERSPRRQLLETLPKNAVGVEIGVHEGDFTKRILRVASPSRLYLIDPWKYESDDEYGDSLYGGTPDTEQVLEDRYRSVQARFATEIDAGRVVVMRSDSESAMAKLEDDSLDFVYIDGNHLYEFVKQDLEASLRKVKPGGYITGDDYKPGSWWKGGVKKAVDEFGWNEAVTLLWIHGTQFVLRKTPPPADG